MKLVINTHIKYGKCLKICLDSLRVSKFSSLEDVIVVVAGSEEDIPPYKKDGMVYINTTLNNFEYVMFNALYQYRDNPLVKSDYYLLTHDTVTFARNFADIFDSWASKVTCSKHSKDKIYIHNADILDVEDFKANIDKNFPGGINLSRHNICIISDKIINRYKNNFSTIVNKKEAILLEFLIQPPSKNIKPISYYGELEDLGRVIWETNTVDIYNTGHNRTCFTLPELGIYKWTALHSNGDILNNRIENVFINIPQLLENGYSICTFDRSNFEL